MNHTIKWIGIGLSLISLASCRVYDDNYGSSYRSYAYDSSQIDTQGAYPLNYYQYSNTATQEVSVPDSYHVGAYHSPVSFKDRDRNWVSSQNPQSYTIEVADDEKASKVAQKLYQAPKMDRSAQIKYQKAGKTYYKGLYGTYNNAEAAQKAFNALPAEIKQGAGIKNWSNVQQEFE